jgi:hypothetical protein
MRQRTEVGHVCKLDIVLLAKVLVVLIDEVLWYARVATGLVVFFDPEWCARQSQEMQEREREA